MMGQCHIGGFGVGGGGYIANAVDYNGSADYLTEQSAGISGSGKEGLISCWVRIDGGDGTTRSIINAGAGNFFVGLNTSNKFTVTATNNSSSTGITSGSMVSSNTYLASSAWIHLLISYNLATGDRHMYINGASDVALGSYTNTTISYNLGNNGFAASYAGVSKFNGCLSELYFTDTYMDISSIGNRLKFRTSNGKPEILGDSGSLPTGVTPIVYLNNPAATINVNKGTLNTNLLIIGSPIDASTSPSN